jgi:hypothetical protein
MRITKVALAGSLVGASIVSGVAFAAWTADGTGSGYAQAKTAQVVSTVTAAADTTADLYPTGAGALKVRVTNPNDYAVTVTGITLGTGSIVSGDSTCDASNGVTFDGSTGRSDIVPAHSNGTLISLAGTVHMSNASVNACSGKSFTVPVNIAAASSAAS